MTKSCSLPTHIVDLGAYRSRREDDVIHAVAYDLHPALGDSVDDVDFAYLVNIAAGVTK